MADRKRTELTADSPAQPGRANFQVGPPRALEPKGAGGKRVQRLVVGELVLSAASVFHLRLSSRRLPVGILDPCWGLPVIAVFLSSFPTFFVVIDPVGSAPIFVVDGVRASFG